MGGDFSPAFRVGGLVIADGKSRAAKRGGFKRGDFPIWTCPSFFVLFCPFRDFPDFSGIFPICSGMVRGFSRFRPFSLCRPIKSSYEEQSLKGPRHKLDLSQKRVGNPPGLETPRFSFSQEIYLSRAELESRNAVGTFPPDPTPQNWTKFLDLWLQEFYPVLGCSLAPS